MVSLAELTAQAPPEYAHDLLPSIRQALRASGRKVVVLDDDPTGTQAVSDIPVLTDWSPITLQTELYNDLPGFFILTNSRSLAPAAAEALNAEIGRNLQTAARRAGRRIAVASRSDSTLHGHFPGEVQALAASLGRAGAPFLLAPAFIEGGRYTVRNIHYIAEGEQIFPAAQSAYAQDPVFGYTNSDLTRWVAEKSQGLVPAEQVSSLSLADLRLGGPELVTSKLRNLKAGEICIANSLSYRDLEVLVSGILAAEEQGTRPIYRTAASFVRVRLGLSQTPYLSARDLTLDSRSGGLYVIGSYTPKSSAQLAALQEALPGLPALQVETETLLADEGRKKYIKGLAETVSAALREGNNLVLYTSRNVVPAKRQADSLWMRARIADGLAGIVRRLTVQPRYLVAKGGITASDLATSGLNVRRAWVRGQVLPGVPVWELGAESRFPGLVYVVFPGNVGDDQALVTLYERLENKP